MLDIGLSQNLGLAINSQIPYIRNFNGIELFTVPSDAEEIVEHGINQKSTNHTIITIYGSINAFAVVKKYYIRNSGVYFNGHQSDTVEIYCHFINNDLRKIDPIFFSNQVKKLIPKIAW